MEFFERVAIVTGGASGIGAACAQRLRDEGARVVTWDVGDGADLHVDVSSEESVSAAMEQSISLHGTPTLLVAAAGIPGPLAPVQHVPLADWERTLAVNLTGVFVCVKAVSAAMIQSGLGGAIVAISSTNGVLADPSVAAYSVTKAGVNHLCRVAALDLGPHGIRVNAIGPGPTATPMIDRFTSTPGYVEGVELSTPLGRIGTADLVADGVINIMRSDWITGQAILVDGGSSLATARGRWRETNVLAKGDN